MGAADPLHQAQYLMECGRFAEAQALLRSLLRGEGHRADTLHALGMCLLRQGDFAQSRSWLLKALKADPKAPLLHVSLGHALRGLNRQAEALASLRRAFALSSGDADALSACANAFEAAGLLDEALDAYGRVLKLRPGDAGATGARATCLLQLFRYEEAVAGFDAALAANPGDLFVLNNRGVALTRLRPEAAIESLDRVISLAAGTLQARAWSNKGNALSELDRFEEALACHERALALDPGLVEAHFCRGAVLQALNRVVEAIACYDRAIGLRPQASADTRMFRAMALLALGRFEEGWPQYEWRGDGTMRLAPESMPGARRSDRWLGNTDPAGRRILFFQEQGHGDAIQFARYLPLLRERGAKLVLRVHRPLIPLLESLHPEIRVVASDDEAGPVDARCPIMSLPLIFDTRLDTIPAATPYLCAGEARIRIWRARLAPDARPRVGIAWSGNPDNINDRRRSVGLARLAPALLPGLQFVSLQNELRSGDVGLVAALPQLQSFATDIRDFQDLAALISLCDLVVCVDTAVAHLAGALGKPVWILLPFSPDFRWLLDRSDSPWYPSARLFRQPTSGAWAPLVQEVAAELARRFSLDPGLAPELPEEIRIAQEWIVSDAARVASLTRSAPKPITRSSRDRLSQVIEMHQRGLREDAIAGYREVLALEPDHFDALRLLGAALLDGGAAAEALPFIERALDQRSDAGEVWALKGVAQGFLGLPQAALLSYDRAVALAPDRPSARFNRGMLQLLLGDLPHGWGGWELRSAAMGLKAPTMAHAPVWDGVQSLQGRKLLLIAEQGLGDAIQFCRYVPLLAQRGARILLTVPPPLRPLMTSLPGIEHMVGDGETVSGFDLQCLLLSCPARFHTTLATIPAAVPYLAAPPERVARWRARLGPGSRMRVGLVSSGNPRHGNDANRSIPLSAFANLLGDTDVEFHVLQNFVRAGDLPWIERPGFVDHRAQLTDFAETAALIECLDAVVSVDTAVAHLAGALNKPLFLLLPKVPDWRWLLDRDDSPWYPSARLFRQAQFGEWQEALHRLATALRQHLTSKRDDGDR